MYSFGRSIAGNEEGQDFNLNADYYVIFGYSDGIASSGGLFSHRTGDSPSNPSVTGEQFSIVEDAGVGGAGAFESVKRGLVRAHGIFMLVAWLLLANTAIFFASYMRPALPNGEWFQVHRAFMITALFLGAAGFVLIFISQARSSPPGLIDLNVGKLI